MKDDIQKDERKLIKAKELLVHINKKVNTFDQDENDLKMQK